MPPPSRVFVIAGATQQHLEDRGQASSPHSPGPSRISAMRGTGPCLAAGVEEGANKGPGAAPRGAHTILGCSAYTYWEQGCPASVAGLHLPQHRRQDAILVPPVSRCLGQVAHSPPPPSYTIAAQLRRKLKQTLSFPRLLL